MYDEQDEPVELTPRAWINYMYDYLRPHVTAAGPVGSDETGWIVEMGIDYPREQLEAELAESLQGDRDELFALLAAALLAYTLERANSEAGSGQRAPEEGL